MKLYGPLIAKSPEMERREEDRIAQKKWPKSLEGYFKTSFKAR